MTRLRRRRGRILIWVLAAVLLVFLGLIAYHKFVNRPRFNANTDLLQEFQSATLVEDETPSGPTDWPQWRGPNRDGVAHEPDLLTQWPAGGPPRLWPAPCGEGYSSFAVANGRAYTLFEQDEQEVVLCLDAATGKEKWR